MKISNSCLIVAGEKSGEEHCMSFFPGLQNRFPTMDFFGVGGDEMIKLGLNPLFHINEFSGWGITGVISKIPFYRKCMQDLIQAAIEKNCRVAILIDFQTFNLILARKLKKLGIEVLYYVAPQAWAWKEFRVKILEANVHTLFTILPFEKKWFEDRGVSRVQSVVHPLYSKYIEQLKNSEDQLELRHAEMQLASPERKIRLLILPGSRDFEVKELLPIFLKTLSELKKKFYIEGLIVKSPTINQETFDDFEGSFPIKLKTVELIEGLRTSHLCLAASGTITLATALFEIPTIVCYRGSLLNQLIYDTVITYRGPISLANIVLDKNLFPELIQDSVTVYNIKKRLENWLIDNIEYQDVVKTLRDTRNKIVGDNDSALEIMIKVIQDRYEFN